MSFDSDDQILSLSQQVHPSSHGHHFVYYAAQMHTLVIIRVECHELEPIINLGMLTRTMGLFSPSSRVAKPNHPDCRFGPAGVCLRGRCARPFKDHMGRKYPRGDCFWTAVVLEVV